MHIKESSFDKNINCWRNPIMTKDIDNKFLSKASYIWPPIPFIVNNCYHCHMTILTSM